MQQLLPQHKPVEKQETSELKDGRKRPWIDALVVLAIVVFVLGAFEKTVFRGQPVSRVCQLAQRDSLFSKYFFPVREAYDQSTYQQHVPNYALAVSAMKKGQAPLWNPLSGCGEPLLADFVACVFNPVRLCFMIAAPDLNPMRAWNLMLVLQLGITAASAYLLARVAGLRLYSSIFAGLVYTFCPLVLGMADLVSNCCCYMPLTMFAFILAAKKRNFPTIALVSLICAVMIISGHPEPPFFGIVLSCIVYLWLVATGEPRQSGVIAKRTILALANIGLIGILSFCLSAYMLLPFLEFLKNSQCYKEGLEGVRCAISWNSVFLNFVHPAYGSFSPFLGITAAMLIPFALITQLRRNHCVQGLTIAFVFACLLMLQPEPLATILSWKSFSWFAPKYCWYALLLTSTMLAAFGFEEYVEAKSAQGKLRFLSLSIATVLPVTLLIGAKVLPGLCACARIDEVFDQLALQPKAFTRDLILLAVLFAAGLAFTRFARIRKPALIAAVAITTMISLGPCAKRALPVQSNFEYDQTAPIPFLIKQNERIISMGRHVLCPNTNMVFGIANLVPANVFHPKRFQNFMLACGVTPEGVNQFFDGKLFPAIDLASIKYVVSPLPVLGTDEDLGQVKELPNDSTFVFGQTDKVRLKAATLRYFPENGEILGKATWQINSLSTKDLAWQSVLLDEKQNVVWFSDLERFEYLFGAKASQNKNIDLERELLVIVPKGLSKDTKLTIGIQLFDWRTQTTVKSDSRIALQNGTIIPLASFPVSGQNQASPPQLVDFSSVSSSWRRFKLVVETDKRIRVYENTKALPQAYIVHQAIKATGPTEAFSLIKSSGFNPKNGVILETLDPIETNTDSSTLAGQDQVTYSRPDINTINIDCRTDKPGYLVLTDTIYTGWKAYIVQNSGRTETPIMPANYLFRGIKVPAGKFVCVFRYEPHSFYTGLGLAVLALIFIGIGFLYQYRPRFKPNH